MLYPDALLRNADWPKRTRDYDLDDDLDERDDDTGGVVLAFEEDEHPRDESGKFADSSGLVPMPKVVPPHLAGLRIPPAWTDVRVSLDPEAALLAQGVDKKGRSQSVYSSAHHMRQTAVKFARIKELLQKDAAIGRQIERDVAAGGKTAEVASVMMLVRATGLRPGSERDTGADRQAYGATTLRAEHVVGDLRSGVRLKFVGKKGVDLDIPVTDPRVAAALVERRATAGQRDGRVFDVSDGDLREYAGGLDGGGFKPKDFRTARGTSLALRSVADAPTPRNAREYKAAVRAVAARVAAALGNTPVIALQSYIDPTAFAKWRGAADVAA